MGLLEKPAAQTDVQTASRQMESMMLQRLLMSSGVFKGSGAAGSDTYGELFAGALADAVTKNGGIGLAATLQQSLESQPVASVPLAPSPIPFQAPPLDTSALVEGTITSGFGARSDPFDGHRAMHTGIDIAAPEGSAVHALSGGVVRSAGPRGGYGNAVEIDHGHGMTTLYAHASELEVQPGDRVEKGQEIAKVGHTGRATGSHLHFEVREGGHPVNVGRALKMYRPRVEGVGE